MPLAPSPRYPPASRWPWVSSERRNTRLRNLKMAHWKRRSLLKDYHFQVSMLNFAAVRSWLVEDILIKRLPVSSSFLQVVWCLGVFVDDQQQKSVAVDKFFGLLPINVLNMMDFYVIHGRNPVPGEFFGNPIKNGSLSMSTGAGFLSSTVLPCFQVSRIHP